MFRVDKVSVHSWKSRKCGHQFQFSFVVVCYKKTKNKALFFLLHYFSLRVINYISHKICINWIRRERERQKARLSCFFCFFKHHQTMLWLKLSSHPFFGVFFTAECFQWVQTRLDGVGPTRRRQLEVDVAWRCVADFNDSFVSVQFQFFNNSTTVPIW